MNIRMLPASPASMAMASVTINGRTYSNPGTFIDMPDFDASVLDANSWIVAAQGGVGATAARPTVNLFPVLEYLDTTLGYIVKWNGSAWINPNTGGVV